MGFFGKLFGKKNTDDEIDEYNRRADAAAKGSSQNVRYTMKTTTTTTTFSTGAPPQMSGNIVSAGMPQTQKKLHRLRNAEIGYDQEQTLKLIESLYIEIMGCTEAKTKGAPMPPPVSIVMPNEERNGFNKQDVEEYITELKTIIGQLRSNG